MDVVIARLFGGLGNQLFQYAVGRAVAERNKCRLLLDTRETDAKGGHWKYALSHFNVTATIGDDSNLPPARSDTLRYYFWRYLSKNPEFIREKHLGFNENINQLSANAYLHGYFQSEKYFADYAEVLHRELAIKTVPTKENERWQQKIDNCNSVSVHVRRGDYAAAGKTYAVCNKNYYDRALEFIAGQAVSEPEVFVFSDDPVWAKQNMRFGVKTHFSDHNDSAKHYEDMRLISCCKHNIVANSTFSWWGSWLNRNPEKIVVAPKDWFGKQKMQNPDIAPESWIRL